MHSQFSKIAKIRQQACDSIEKELAKASTKEQAIQQQIALLYDEVNALEMPKQAPAWVLVSLMEQKRCFFHYKQQLEDELKELQSHILILQEAYKKARIEYEKIHYLEEQAFQSMLDKLKKEEQQGLDEMSTQLFARKMHKRSIL